MTKTAALVLLLFVISLPQTLALVSPIDVEVKIIHALADGGLLIVIGILCTARMHSINCPARNIQ